MAGLTASSKRTEVFYLRFPLSPNCAKITKFSALNKTSKPGDKQLNAAPSKPEGWGEHARAYELHTSFPEQNN